jgi:hypothetical protein
MNRQDRRTALGARGKQAQYTNIAYVLRLAALSLALIACTTLLAGNVSAAATPGAGIIYLPNGSNGGLTSPLGGTWVGLAPSSTTPGRMWVSDHQQGFCRLEPIKGSKPPQWSVAVKVTDSRFCFPAGNAGVNTPGVPDFQMIAGSTNLGYAYVPFSAGNAGVFRLTIDYLKQQITATETLATAAALGAKFTPIAVSFGADGKLYVADNTGGILVRITNPAGALGTQVVEQVGLNSTGGKFITGMAMKGNDWYNAAGSFLFRLASADACNGGCLGLNLNINSQAVGVDRNSQYVYWDVFGILVNAEILFRYDSGSGELVEYSNGGYLDAAKTFFTTYASIFGVTVDPSGNIYVIDDTSGGVLPDATRPIVPNAARIWMIPAGSPPFLNNPGPITPPPTAGPPPPPPTGGQLYASNTRTRTTLWIPGATAGSGHLWVSDPTSGFCRVDVGTTSALSNCFKASTLFVPGQASYGNTFDANQNLTAVNIYVPDTASNVVYRVAFDPATETTGAALGLSLGLNNRPSAAIVGLDGSVYLSYSNLGQIDKITGPATNPALVTKVGRTFSGSGVSSMTFINNNLFLAEATEVSELMNASPSLTGGAAQLIGGPFTKKQTPPLQVGIPLSLGADQANNLLYIGNSGSLYSFSLTSFVQTLVANSGTAGTTTVPFGAITAVGFVPTSITGVTPGSLFVGDDSGTGGLGLGRIWKLQ